MTDVEFMRSYPLPLHPRSIIGWYLYGKGRYIIFHWDYGVNCTIGLN